MRPKMFSIKQGDTAPPLKVILRNHEKAAVSIAGAEVKFLMRANKKGVDTPKIDKAATNKQDAGGATGEVWFGTPWLAADETNELGEFLGEFEVTFADTTKQTFPSKGHVIIQVTEDLE